MAGSKQEAEYEFVIEDGVPIPETMGDFPWEKVKAGQSVVVPKNASSAARSFVKRSRPGWSVKERTLKPAELDARKKGEEPGSMIRVWFLGPKEVTADGGQDPNPVEGEEDAS